MAESISDADLELVERIHLAVRHHPHIRRRFVRYEAAAGRVLIRGRVDSYFEKQMAQEALRSIDGVTAIDNDVEVCW